MARRSQALSHTQAEFAYILLFVALGALAILFLQYRAAREERAFLLDQIARMEEKKNAAYPCWIRPDGVIPQVAGTIIIHSAGWSELSRTNGGYVEIRQPGGGISPGRNDSPAGEGITRGGNDSPAGEGISPAGDSITDAGEGTSARGGISPGGNATAAGDGFSRGGNTSAAGEGISPAGDSITDARDGTSAGEGISPGGNTTAAGEGVSRAGNTSPTGNGISPAGDSVATAGGPWTRRDALFSAVRRTFQQDNQYAASNRCYIRVKVENRTNDYNLFLETAQVLKSLGIVVVNE